MLTMTSLHAISWYLTEQLQFQDVNFVTSIKKSCTFIILISNEIQAGSVDKMLGSENVVA